MRLGREIVELASGRSKRILDRDLGMLVPGVVGCMIDHNFAVLRNGKPDVNLEAGAVAMLMAFGDHRHPASR